MTDTPASSTNAQKSNPTGASSPTSTPPSGLTEPQEHASTPSQVETSPDPQPTTSPYSTTAPTPEELEEAKTKAEALITGKEPKKEETISDSKTTLMASGDDDSSKAQDRENEPPAVEAPSQPQEHAKNGSKALKVVGLVALVLVIGGGIGVGVTRLSSPTQTTETRSQALQASGVIDNREIMPDMYRYLVQKYVSQDSTTSVDLSIKAVTMAEPDAGISGSAYFKYDPKEDLAFVFSRITGLTSENETVPKLWIQRGSEYKLLGDSEYLLLGEMALTSEPEGTVAYFTAYYDDPTILAFDWLIVSYDSPEEEEAPQSIVAKVSTILTSE